MAWNLSNCEVGDYIQVRVSNPHGARNMDGTVLCGTVVQLDATTQQAKLDKGWWVHATDDLLEHRKKGTSTPPS